MIGATIGEVLKVLGRSWKLVSLLALAAPMSLAAIPFQFYGGKSGQGTGLQPMHPAPAVAAPLQGYAAGPGGMTAKAAPRDSREMLRVVLAGKSAEPFEAGGTLRRLRFIGIDFDTSGDSNRMLEPGGRQARDIGLSLALPRDLGVVVIAAEPVAWKVAHGGSKERARIGFEGAAPFTIDAPNGVMSAFRIGALGGRRPGYPLEPVGETQGNLNRFCSVLSRWAHHFDVIEWNRIEYVRLVNPGRVAIGDDIGVTGSGRIASRYSGTTLRTMCFGPQRASTTSGTRATTGRVWNPVTRQYN